MEKYRIFLAEKKRSFSEKKRSFSMSKYLAPSREALGRRVLATRDVVS